MEFEFKMPPLGENVEAGEVTNVLVREGDRVSQGQDLIEVEAAKAIEPLASPRDGTVARIHVKVGDSVPVGGTLITLSVVGEKQKASGKGADAPAVPPQGEVREPPPSAGGSPAAVSAPAVGSLSAPAFAEARSPASATAPRRVQPEAAQAAVREEGPFSRSIPAGPATRRLARELGVDLAGVKGSGRGGRITREDVVAAVREVNAEAAHFASERLAIPRGAGITTPPGKLEQDAFGRVRREAMSAIRKSIAAHLVHSANTIPHVTNFDDADITELERIRKGGMADYEGTSVKLTMLPFVMKAVAHALRQHPVLNASLDMDQQEIVYKEYIHLGIAVDTDRGLIVPVVRHVDRLSIPQLAVATTELIDRVRAGKFSPADVQGGTFSISNLGAIGGTYATPVINHPEVAILLVGRSRKLPVVVDEQIQIRLMMPLSLSYDHRLVDGAMAARFLNEIKAYLETPGRLLLAP